MASSPRQLDVEAQQRRTTPHVGVLVAESAPHPFTGAFRSGMRELGYVEGRTVAIEWRYADGLFARAVELATELVRLKPSVIVVSVTEAALAVKQVTGTVKQVTGTIPIVTVSVPDPVAAGLVASLARPGGNVTGLSRESRDLIGKNLLL